MAQGICSHSPRKTEVDNKKAKHAPRNQWTLCKIIKTNSDNQGIARSVTLLLGIDDNNNRKRILERPISKLILILEANDMDSPKKRA